MAIGRQRYSHSVRIRVVLAGAAAAILTLLCPGCSAESGSTARPPDPSTTGDVEPLKSLHTASGDTPHLHGVVLSVSDVGGQPDRALGPASLLIVPLDAAEAFWTSQGFAPSGREAPNDFALDAAALPESVVITPVDSNGRFAVDVKGDALLCLADLYGQDAPPSPPRYVQGGCVLRPGSASNVTLQSEGSTTLVVPAS